MKNFAETANTAYRADETTMDFDVWATNRYHGRLATVQLRSGLRVTGRITAVTNQGFGGMVAQVETADGYRSAAIEKTWI